MGRMSLQTLVRLILNPTLVIVQSTIPEIIFYAATRCLQFIWNWNLCADSQRLIILFISFIRQCRLWVDSSIKGSSFFVAMTVGRETKWFLINKNYLEKHPVHNIVSLIRHVFSFWNINLKIFSLIAYFCLFLLPDIPVQVFFRKILRNR